MPRTPKSLSDDRSPGDMSEDAAEFTHVSEDYRRYIQEGLDDVAAGRVHDWEDVKAEMREKYGDLFD